LRRKEGERGGKEKEPLRRGCPCPPHRLGLGWALAITHPNCARLSLVVSGAGELACSWFSWDAVSLDRLLPSLSDEKCMLELARL